MSYEPVDIVEQLFQRALRDDITRSEMLTDLNEWRDALVAELERLATTPNDKSPLTIAYRHAARLVRGDAKSR